MALASYHQRVPQPSSRVSSLFKMQGKSFNVQNQTHRIRIKITSVYHLIRQHNRHIPLHGHRKRRSPNTAFVITSAAKISAADMQHAPFGCNSRSFPECRCKIEHRQNFPLMRCNADHNFRRMGYLPVWLKSQDILHFGFKKSMGPPQQREFNNLDIFPAENGNNAATIRSERCASGRAFSSARSSRHQPLQDRETGNDLIPHG